MSKIDLRSDTLTKPCQKMRNANLFYEFGDDVYEEDEIVKRLETEIANYLKKDSALFFPTGTMANLTALLTWCDKRGSEVIVGNKNHIFLFEQGGASQFGGISYSTIATQEDGTMNIEDIENAIREVDIHETMTSLIAIENTHNACGGKILPLEYLRDLKELANKYKIPIHMDGARLWNALEEYTYQPEEILSCVDSVSVCLSKGLGAPMGSLLVGSYSFINKARRCRKALGGGMRQTGFVASAGLVAFDNFKNHILKYDHDKIKKIKKSLQNLKNFEFQKKVETNILFIKINDNIDDEKVINYLKTYNIYLSHWDKHLLRIVIHKDITDEDVDTIIQTFLKLDKSLN